MKKIAAIRKCAEWLKYCLDIGWDKKDIPALEKLWWQYHDEYGNLIKAQKQTHLMTLIYRFQNHCNP